MRMILVALLAVLVLSPFRSAVAQPELVPMPINEETNVGRLLDLLTDASPVLRAKAAERLGNLGENAHAAEPLAALLHDNDIGVRAAAAFSLAQLRDARALDTLLALALDKNTQRRSQAIRMLCMLDGTKAVDVIVTAMKDGNTGVRSAAAGGMMQLAQTHPELLYPILPDLFARTPGRVQPEMLQAVQCLRAPSAIPCLLALNKNPQVQVRVAVLNALANIRSAQAIPPVLAALQDADPQVPAAAARSAGQRRITQAADRLFHLLDDHNVEVNKAAGTALAELHDSRALLPLLARLNRTDPSVREEAVKGLGELGDMRAVAPLVARLQRADRVGSYTVMAALSQLMQAHPDAPEMQPVAEALCQLARGADVNLLSQLIPALSNAKTPAVLPVFLEILKKAKSPAFRPWISQAVGALGQFKDPRVVAPLLALTHDQDENIRCQVISALGTVGDLRGIPVLLAGLHDRSDNIRNNALQALQNMPDIDPDRMLPALTPMLATINDNDGIHEQVFQLLARYHNAHTVNTLFAMLGEQNPQVRRGACGALVRIDDPQINARCLALLAAKQPLVRQSALAVLGSKGDECAIPSLIQCLRSGDVELRTTALQDLRGNFAVISWPAALTTTGKALLHDANAEMRVTGVAALALTGNPAVTDDLLTALRDHDPRVRQQAVESLSAFSATPLNAADSPVVTALLAEWKDEQTAGVRLAALQTLGQYCHDPRVIDVLVAAARDADHKLRQAAFNASANCPDVRMTEALLASLSMDDEELRNAAQGQLQNRSDTHTVDLLLPLLQSKDDRARECVSNILRQSDDPRAIQAIIPALTEQGEGQDLGEMAGINHVRNIPQIDGQPQENLNIGAAKLDVWLPSLHDERLELRLAVITALARSDAARAVPALLTCAGDPDPLVRFAVMRTLGGIGDLRALDTLLAALHGDADDRVRAAAALALGSLGDVRAVEPLLAALQGKDGDTLYLAAHALGVLKDRRAVPALLPLLHHADGGVRAQAAWALGEMPDARAAQPLLARLQDTGEARNAAMRAIGKLAAANVALPVLAKAVAPLRALLVNCSFTDELSGATSRSAIAALAALGDAQAVAPLLTLAARQAENMTEEDAAALAHFPSARTMHAILIAMRGNVSDAWATPAVLARLDAPALQVLFAAVHDSDARMRAAAAVVLGRFAAVKTPQAEHIRQALQAAMADNNRNVRESADHAMTLWKETRVGDALLQRLQTATDNESIDTLCLLGDVRVLDPLLKLMAAPKTGVTDGWEPIDSLRKLVLAHPGAPEYARAVPVLLTNMHDDSYAIHRQASCILGYLGDRRAAPALIEVVQNRAQQGRADELRALVATHDPGVYDALVAALREPDMPRNSSYDDILLYEQAARSLGELGDPRAVPPLIAALDYGDPSFRRFVAVALGKLKDPRAVEPLITALRRFTPDNRPAAAEALKAITGKDFGLDADKWVTGWKAQ